MIFCTLLKERNKEGKKTSFIIKKIYLAKTTSQTNLPNSLDFCLCGLQSERSHLQAHPLDTTVNFSSQTPFVKNRADLQFFTQHYFTKNTHSLRPKLFQKCVLLRKDSCSRQEGEGRTSSPNELPMRGAITSISLAKNKIYLNFYLY